VAQNEINIKVKISDDGSLSLVSQKAEQAAKSTEKLANSRDRYSKGEKGVAGATSNSTKAFSKMQQSIGSGSSGLVAAYATLAANIFALTAAFGVLRRAAAFEQLTAGLDEVGAASGRNLPFTARKLQEVTDGAISAEQALRATAVASSAGFSSGQLEKLTKVAKGASIALGRDMGDALDRLVRGTAKLEPEILDELGIIVRLDDATRDYAAALGKTATDLTTFERQQAFLNATTEQGLKKFGDIAESLDANPYDQLAASFANLAQTGLELANKVLVPIVNLLAESPGALLGVLILFTKSIASSLLPSIGAIAIKYREVGTEASKAFKASSKVINKEFALQQKAVGTLAASTKVLPASVQKLVPAFKNGTLSAKELNIAVVNLKKSESLRAVALKNYTGETLAAKELELAAIRKLRIETEALQAAESKRLVAGAAGSAAGAQSRSGKRAGGVFDKIASVGALGGFAAALKGTKLEFKDTIRTFKKEGKALGGVAARANLATNSLRGVGLAARFAGAAFLNAIPGIGTFLFLLSMLASFLPESFIEFFTRGNKVVDEATERFDNFGKVASKLDQYLAGDRTAREASNAILRTRIGLMRELSASINQVVENSESEAEARQNVALVAQEFLKNSKAKGTLDIVGKEAEGVIKNIRRAMTSGRDTGFAQELIEGAIEPLASVDSSIEGVGGAISEVKTAFADFGRSARGPMADIIQRLRALNNEAVKAAEGVKGLDAGLKEADTKDLFEIAKKLLVVTGSMPSLEKAAGVLADEIERLDLSYIAAVEKSKELIQQSKEVGKVAKNNAFAAGLQVDLQNKALDSDLAALLAREKQAKYMDDGIKKTRELADIAAERSRLEAKRVTDEEKSLTVVTAIVGARRRNLSIAQKLAGLQRSTLELELQATKATKQQKVGRALTPEEEIAIEESFLSRKLAMEDKALSNKLEAIRLDFTLLAKQIEFEKARIKDLKAIHGDTSSSAVDSVSPVNVSNVTSEMEQLLKDAAGFNKIILTGAADAKIRSLTLRRAQLEVEKQRAHTDALRDAGLDILANTKEQITVTREIGDIRKEINNLIRDGQGGSIAVLEKELALIGLIAKKRKLTGEKARASYDTLGQMIGGGTGTAISSMGDIASLTAQKGLDEKRLGKQTAARDAMSLKVMDMEARGAPIDEINASREALGKLKEDVLTSKEVILSTNDEITRSVFNTFSTAFSSMAEDLSALGPEGAVAGALSAGVGQMIADVGSLRDVIQSTFKGVALESFEAFAAAWDKASLEEKAQVVSAAFIMAANAIGSAASAMAASANNRISGIDKQIDAENKLDGKSAESVAKIKALEAKKEQIKKKAFETDKKMKMAQAVMSIAAGVAAALSMGPFGIPLIPIIVGMGAMQLAAISSMTFQGGASSVASAAGPTQVKVGGDRRSTTDLAKSQGAGGELAYFRGGQGIGGPENFRPAASGMKYRANGGNTAFMVGEQGPEMFIPERPGTIVPSDETPQLGTPINANINITALDADGVEDILMNQRGNIIGMLRDAANANGETFLESVSVQEY